MLDRRDFVTWTLGAAVAASAGVYPGIATAAPPGDWRNLLIINALGDLEDPNPVPGAQPQSGPVGGVEPLALNERAIKDALASGLNAINVTLGYVSGDMEPFEYTISEIGRWDAIVRARSTRLMRIYDASDIQRARAEHKVGVIYGFQNAAMVGTHPERVDIFANLGVRVIQLTYNPANPLGDGSMAPENRGLTPLGHAVVERLNARRVMVDLSHSGQQTCLDAARSSKQPISINHTGCRALNDVPRNKTDEELRLVATRGGFVGIYFMPFLNPTGHAKADDVVAHIEHAVELVVERMGWGEIGRARRHMDELAVAEPQLVDPARAWPGGIHKGNRPRVFRHRDVE